MNKRIWSPTPRVPGFPLSRKRRQNAGASALLTLSALWPGLGPTSLTSSPFSTSEPRQGLHIRAVPFQGSCGTLGPAGSLWAPWRSVGSGGWGRALRSSWLLLQAPLLHSALRAPHPLAPSPQSPRQWLRPSFLAWGVQARPGLPPWESQRFPKVKSVSQKEAPQTQIPEP